MQKRLSVLKSNSKTTRVALAALILFGLVLMPATAFPLTGGNGITNATVAGVMIAPYGGYSSQNTAAGNLNYVNVDIVGKIDGSIITLVDSEDRFYDMGIATYIELDKDNVRTIYRAKIPANAEIKRIRIAPPAEMGDPFSIEWAGAPQTNDSTIDMKFYGIQSAMHDRSGILNTWHVDFKITNKETQKLHLDPRTSAIVDQFGYLYKGDIDRMDLMPGESARLDMKIDPVSALSRPIYLKYIPTGLLMDVSAWA